MQMYNGSQYLTYWNGDICSEDGCGFGNVTFLDNTYSTQYTVCVQDSSVVRLPGTPNTNPCVSDFHDSRMTDRNTLLTTGRSVVKRDLTPYGGLSDGYVRVILFPDRLRREGICVSMR